MSPLGLGTEFRSEKFPRNRHGTIFVNPRKKALIPRHSEFRGRAISEARNGADGIPRKKFVLRNSSKITEQNDLSVHQMSSFLTLFLTYSAAHFVLSWFLFHGMVRNGIPRVYFYFLMHGKEFWVVLSSAEWFGTKFQEFASIFVPRNGIPSCFLFLGKVRNGIPRFSVPRNNRNYIGNNYLFCLFRLPQNYFFVGNSQT